MNRVNVPQLRFPGFDGEWELKKVGQLCDSIVPGRNKPTNFDGDIPWITTPDIEHNGIISYSKKGLNISRNEAKKVGSKIVPINSIIISCVGELGLSAIAGKEIIINQQLHAFIPKEKIEYRFLLYQLNLKKKYMDKVATKTAVPYMNKDNCNSIPIDFPALPEQQKIASFLSAVDEKIQQLSRKKELLSQYKKGVMQQLFSGKLRFKDENGKDYADWEEKSFGSVTKFINGKAYKQTELLSEGKYRVLRVGNLFSNNEWYYSDLELEKDKYIEKGDLIYAWSASFGPRFWDEEKLIYHYHIWKVIPNHSVDKQFLFHTFMFDVEKLKTQSQGGTMFHITKGNIESRLFNFPCVEEQQKIANFLSSIDTKIESTSQQINQTQSFKKGLLQQLFV